jgi:hypothetical protein
MGRLVRTALLRLSPADRWKDHARKAAAVLRSFTLTMNPDGSTTIGAGQVEPAYGEGDSGELDADLVDLLVNLGEAAKEHGRGVVFLFDEVQFVSREDLTALVVALHKCVQKAVPIALVVAGLPLLPGLVGAARSYAERLFTYPEIGRLAPVEAERAITEPARAAGVTYAPEAAQFIVDYTEGYPYFVQEMGSMVWDLAETSPIDLATVERSVPELEARLDADFFQARTARTTELELAYLRAMAELPSGPKTSGAIAARLGYGSSAQVGTTRLNLIKKGLIYTPGQGLADFTVPQFDRYLKRTVEHTPRGPKRRPAR